MTKHWDGPDHSGHSEAMALATRLIVYWAERGVAIKAWLVEHDPTSRSKNPMYHVRTNLCPVTMTAKPEACPA